MVYALFEMIMVGGSDYLLNKFNIVSISEAIDIMLINYSFNEEF